MIHRTLIAAAGSIESLGDENYALCVLLVRCSDPGLYAFSFYVSMIHKSFSKCIIGYLDFRVPFKARRYKD